MTKVQEINVKDTTVRTMKVGSSDYICITDIARQKNALEPNAVVGNWMRNRNTIEYLGIWEYLNNPSFNPIEFEGFKQQAGNMRDYATINQLICLSNMENLNAVFINEGIPQRDRLHKLNKIAIQQMTVLEEVGNRKLLK